MEEVQKNLMRAPKTPIHTVSTCIRRQPPKVKGFLAVVTDMVALVMIKFIIHNHDNLFVVVEAVHSVGISILIYKLMKENTCTGSDISDDNMQGRSEGETVPLGLHVQRGSMSTVTKCCPGIESDRVKEIGYCIIDWVIHLLGS